tara:strand:+ start:141 stop:392 length:252 start_codon:yes stop_codon:yes gene_type:complete
MADTSSDLQDQTFDYDELASYAKLVFFFGGLVLVFIVIGETGDWYLGGTLATALGLGILAHSLASQKIKRHPLQPLNAPPPIL